MKVAPYITLAISLTLFAKGSHADWSDWENYITITHGKEPFITIEVRTYFSKNWHPKIQWRAKNHSLKTLYCASLGDRHYSLSNGEKINYGGEGCRKITPGETEQYIVDTVGEDGVMVKKASMEYFTFSYKKGGEIQKASLR